jgi:PiT family inorganic phosphate transporter
MVMIFKGLKNLKLDLEFGPALAISSLVGIIAAAISAVLVRKVQETEDDDDPADIAGDESAPDEEQVNVDPATLRSLRKAAKHLQKALNNSGEDHETDFQISEIAQKLETVENQLTRASARPPHKLDQVERIFVYLQILSACFVAFAHGANDVANAIGPLAAVISILDDGLVAAKSAVPIWVLAFGGIGIVIGLATWGWRVIETIGKKITELTPTRGFSAEFGAAVTIVVASRFGLPISTTHTLVGAVLGVGLARGIGALNLATVRNIVVSWVVTIPAGALLAIIFYYVLSAAFG